MKESITKLDLAALETVMDTLSGEGDRLLEVAADATDDEKRRILPASSAALGAAFSLKVFIKHAKGDDDGGG